MGDREHGARRVEPHPGHGQGRLQRAREASAVPLEDVPGAPVQVAGAVVVAEARPAGQDLLLGRRGQRRQVGERLQERLVIGDRGLHRRLLEHHLRDPDAVRVARAPPGKVAPVASIPVEERPAQARRAHASTAGTASVARRPPPWSMRSMSAPRPRSFSSMR